MALTSRISPYDNQWPVRFLATRLQMTQVFGNGLVAIHHVGSTAVAGLAAKPEIDVLVVVEQHDDQARRTHGMQALGYVRGSDLSVGHHFYRRDVNGVRTHKVHVCLTGHAQIEWMLRFRDLLRSNQQVRQQYQALKLALEAGNTGGIGEYLAQKAPFIDAAMQATPATTTPPPAPAARPAPHAAAPASAPSSAASARAVHPGQSPARPAQP